MPKGLKRTPWTRRHALNLFKRIGIEPSADVYRRLRKRWVGDANVPAELKVHIILCGAVCEWLENLAQSQLIRCVERQRRLNEDCAIEKASSSILSNLATDMGAILALCRVGYDVQARSLLRGFIERMDLLICVRCDAHLSAHYLDAQSPKDSRDFFYKNISGGKLPKKAKSLFKREFPDADFIYDWVLGDWRIDTNLMLASVAHANHSVGIFSLFPNLGRGRSDALGFGGHPTNGSNVTISMLLTACMPMHFLFASYPHDEVSEYLREAELDTEALEQYRVYHSLLLTFPLVDTWLQDLNAAIRDFPERSNIGSFTDASTRRPY